MGKQFPALEESHLELIRESQIFFVGTAGPSGHVNISPKGQDSLRVLGPNRILWRNLTGSGNETAGHLKLINRMTLMWCSFTQRPIILRCYGTAKMIAPNDDAWAACNAHFPSDPGARQIFEMNVELVQSSCGFAVPLMDFREERDVLRKWSANQGKAGIQKYWRERNGKTIDGYDTGIGDQLEPE